MSRSTFIECDRLEPKTSANVSVRFEPHIIRWQYDQRFYPNPHSIQLECPVTRSGSETEIKFLTTDIPKTATETNSGQENIMKMSCSYSLF